MNQDLKTTIQSLPHSSGVYHYYDKQGHLLYIGKAKDLYNRVKSYWRFSPELHPNNNLSLRIVKMLHETASLSIITVANEHDALILENSLIKQLKPKYNILLRDDKTYPYIYMNTKEPFARLEITRKVLPSKEITYFGPYSTGARAILDSIYELIALVQKKSCLNGKKACLYYQMQRCLAPCEFNISTEHYNQLLEEAIALIHNKKLLLEKLHERMEFLSIHERFEEAITLRDRIQSIQKSEYLSPIDFANDANYDVFLVQNSSERAVIVRLFMRQGKIISSSHDFFKHRSDFDKEEAYERALLEFYTMNAMPTVAPILVADDFSGLKSIEALLHTTFHKKVTITVPQRGKKRKLIALAEQNANELLRIKAAQNEHDSKALATLCELTMLPERIEVFDNSHLSGEAPVGAMIVFDNQQFDKASYRQYHLEARDEYAQMRETLMRRIQAFQENPPPDLWILDGGSTLLQLALSLLQSAGVNLDVIAISKEKIDAKAHRAKGGANDIIHTPSTTLTLKPSDKRLQFVQRLRDEAHRFAITFHKKSKLNKDKQSELFSLHGISKAKVKRLLDYFGTFQAIKEASLHELETVLSKRDANTILKIYK